MRCTISELLSHVTSYEMSCRFVYGKKSDQEKERPIREIIFNRCPNPGAEKAAKIMQNLKNWLDKARKSFRADEGPDFEMFYEQIIECDPVRLHILLFKNYFIQPRMEI